MKLIAFFALSIAPFHPFAAQANVPSQPTSGLGGTPVAGLCMLSRPAVFANSKVGVAASARLKELTQQADAELAPDRKALEVERQALADQEAKLSASNRQAWAQVGAPVGDQSAHVIATGTSKASGRQFNLAVAFEPSPNGGPGIAQSTFHHFADFNWDPAKGCPSFADETPGTGLAQSLEAQRSIRRYVQNLALWLAGRERFEDGKGHLDQQLDEALDETFPASDPPAVGYR